MVPKVEDALTKLAERVVACERCPRLRSYCEKVAKTKKKAYMNWNYWGKPLQGFGDSHARLLIIGLAPAAHGGNRTGRMFTGDGSGDWLVKALFEVGLASQSSSVSRFDGLRLMDCYITAIVRCAPPGNKPMRNEIANCFSYLSEEMQILRNVELVLTLGRVAFESYLNHLPTGSVPRPFFRHRGVYEMNDGIPTLIASYHPSRQNTQTGRLTWDDWMRVFREIRNTLN